MAYDYNVVVTLKESVRTMCSDGGTGHEMSVILAEDYVRRRDGTYVVEYFDHNNDRSTVEVPESNIAGVQKPKNSIWFDVDT